MYVFIAHPNVVYCFWIGFDYRMFVRGSVPVLEAPSDKTHQDNAAVTKREESNQTCINL